MTDEKKIIALSKERSEGDQAASVSRIVDSIKAYEALGQIKGVCCVATLNGGKVYLGAYSELSRKERLALVGALEEIKASILLDDGPTHEHIWSE